MHAGFLYTICRIHHTISILPVNADGSFDAVKTQTGFLSHLYIKCIVLPRQARDKHRENSKKPRFVEGEHDAL
jgi:hypothetical protein